jgi:amidase
MAELWALSAVEVARGVRTRAFSAREVVQACLARIAATNPQLNALVEVSADEAWAAAAEADAAVASGAALGPMHGVPVAVKANTDQAGHATSNGVPAWADRIADRDAPHIARLRAAGAIFVGRSNTPAFSMRWCSENDLHGRTLNPWDPGRTPGGSSGGAAAAVAAGMVAVGQGGDYGGSIRYPAHACGIAGIRPTVGLIPHAPASGGTGHLSWTLMATEGPLAREVADLRLSVDAMSGTDPRDPFAPPVGPIREPPTRPVRVGLLRDPGVVAPAPAVDAALTAAAGFLTEAGYAVEEVALGLFAEAYRLWYLLAIEDNRRDLAVIRELGGEGASRSFDTQLAVARQWWSPEPDLPELLRGYDRHGRLIRQLGEVLGELPLLLMPVSAEPPFAHGEDIASDESAIRLAAANWSCMAIPCLGAPAISVPAAVADGLPVGVQLVAGRFREDLLLDAAEVIEARNDVATPVDVTGAG